VGVDATASVSHSPHVETRTGERVLHANRRGIGRKRDRHPLRPSQHSQAGRYRQQQQQQQPAATGTWEAHNTRRTADCCERPQTDGGWTTPFAAAGSRFQKLAVSVNALPPTVSVVAFSPAQAHGVSICKRET
jgi:hypothetical protein